MLVWKNFLKSVFNISGDTATLTDIEERIKSNSVLHGTNMAILVLAMLIASIGLNVNSTAVVIGAMLISPLMGVIMGVAYGFATYDANYTKTTILRLLYQTVFCVLASTIYFAISPLDTPSSELLARTSPAIWDVLIAIFGGFAGIIGQTRTKISNVIPGVAIATALMPPLCTAGFGLANHNYHFFFGALYLYFINCFFICVTSIIILKVIHVPAYKYTTNKALRNQKMIFWILCILVVVPSLWATYISVSNNLRDMQVNSYIAKEFDNDYARQVVRHTLNTTNKILYITIIGNELTQDEISKLNRNLHTYTQLTDYNLQVVQNHNNLDMKAIEKLIDSQQKTTPTDSKLISTDSPEYINYRQAYLIERKESRITEKLNDTAPVLFPEIAKIRTSFIKDIQDKETTYTMVAIVYVKQPLLPKEVTRIKAWLEKETGVSVILSVLLNEPNANNLIQGNGIAW